MDQNRKHEKDLHKRKGYNDIELTLPRKNKNKLKGTYNGP